jgi:hypothetical protein
MIHNPVECEALFNAFKFEPLRDAEPPKKKGIYAVRIASRGRDLDVILEEAGSLLKVIDWPMLDKKVRSRLSRLKRIGECPYIYVGSAGPRASSKHTLWGRYKDLSGRHTAMFPIWALVYFGWALDYGWLEGEGSKAMEATLKSSYREAHDGRLPALVHT